MALSLPDAVESHHMDHPDFRVRGKIFATLGYPDEEWGMVKLTPVQQSQAVEEEPEAFVPVKGAWGFKGGTNVNLRSVTKKALRAAIEMAWANMAPQQNRPSKK